MATKAKALSDARRAARLLEQAEERLAAAIRVAAGAEASRAEIADAVGLSKTSVQRIVATGANR